jgi:hypothetical protein
MYTYMCIPSSHPAPAVQVDRAALDNQVREKRMADERLRLQER